MVVAFQVILLIVIFLSVAMLFSKEFEKETKMQVTAMGIASIIGYMATLMWL